MIEAPPDNEPPPFLGAWRRVYTAVLIYLACITLTNFNERVVLPILFVVGISFPLAFYHHAWALWLAMDHLIEGLSRQPGKL